MAGIPYRLCPIPFPFSLSLSTSATLAKMELQSDRRIFWTDSMAVIPYVANESRSFHVLNHVAFII